MRLEKYFVVAALIMGDLHLYAHDFSVEYTSELQTDYQNCNYANLLRLNYEAQLCNPLSLNISTISIAKTLDAPLINDIQTFSNIEEEDLPLAPAVCGLCLKMRNHTLSIGIRNMNEDYFVSDITSFFTNSSCGVYPTIGSNYPIANYPLASLGIHYKAVWGIGSHEESSDTLSFQTSFYNGKGYKRITHRDNVFRFCPQEDGFFALAETEYLNKSINAYLGTAMYYKERVSVTPWLYAEQKLNEHFNLLAGYSHAFINRTACSDFVGIGALCILSKSEIGIFTDFARFAGTDEWGTELSCKFSVNEHIYLQPVTHLILTGSQFNNVCCLRLGAVY